MVILVAWLTTTGWLVRYEAYPHLFTKTVAGYQSMFRHELLVMDAWWQILFQGSPIGWSHTQVDINEDNPHEYYAMENHAKLVLNMMGTDQHLAINTEAYLDAEYLLQRFRFETITGSTRTLVTGVRKTGIQFEVKLGEHRSLVDIPDDTVIYSPVTDLAVKSLRPGQAVTLKVFNPLTQLSESVRIVAEEQETIEYRGKPVATTRLAMSTHGMKILAWMDPGGTLLRQETPMGWVIETSDAKEVMQQDFATLDTPELLRAMAVRSAGSIPNPRQCTRLKIRLRGVPFETNRLTSARQRVLSAKRTETILEIRSQSLPNHISDATGGTATAAHLRSTAFVQTRHPEIQEAARRATKSASTPLEKARALAIWVDRTIKDRPRASLPSALDVLRVKEGDCNEHTYLYVALARALDIPSKIVIGLVYNEGAFYYHAWPAVYLDQWYEMDPTLHQVGVDATHIALLEGELGNQFELARIFGRVEIDIIEANTANQTTDTH
jgi:hypothetical protein